MADQYTVRPFMPPRTNGAGPAEGGSWKSDLLRNGKGEPRPLLANVLTALRGSPEWRGVLGFDELASQVVVKAALPWAPVFSTEPPPWTDLDDARLAEWCQREGILIGPEVAAQAVQVVAADRPFHPVRDFLRGLSWDQKPRLDGLLPVYFGGEDSGYARAVGAKALISAVARVMRPGCKCDHVLILEGRQGAGKSSALQVLGGRWFTDELSDLGSKDAAMQMRAAWIVEVAELDAMSRSEVSRLKAFFSRTTDRFRPPYGRRIVEMPRQSVFIGSTNDSRYLRDETGARRFWPVRCGEIDLSALKRDMQQIWAEAVVRFNQGETWWLVDHLSRRAAEDAQAERYVGDPWEDQIADHLRTAAEVSLADLLGGALSLEVGRWGQSEQNRVARILIRLGWERFQKRTPSGDREWRYRPARTAAGDTVPTPNAGTSW